LAKKKKTNKKKTEEKQGGEMFRNKKRSIREKLGVQ